MHLLHIHHSLHHLTQTGLSHTPSFLSTAQHVEYVRDFDRLSCLDPLLNLPAPHMVPSLLSLTQGPVHVLHPVALEQSSLTVDVSQHFDGLHHLQSHQFSQTNQHFLQPTHDNPLIDIDIVAVVVHNDRVCVAWS
jgi:hypothetical protein